MDKIVKELIASLRDDFLELIILPTEKCNFRCVYCYENFSIGQMNKTVVNGIKNIIKNHIYNQRALFVSWFGGEPLLALPIIDDISSCILSTIGERTTFHYKANMTTNGYLLNLSTIRHLSKLGIEKYQISLDGPKLQHDRTRILANGNGSFNQIWDNLLAIRGSATSVKIMLRIHLTPDNLNFMPEFLTQVQETFLDDKRFSVLLKPIAPLGGPNDKKMKFLTEKQQAEILSDLKSMLLNSGTPDNYVSIPADTDICYAAKHNSVVIRSNGNLCKCTVKLNDPANIIGQLLPDGTLQIDPSRQKPWLRGWKARDTAILSCPANGISSDTNLQE
ncbi:MAG: radical SAM protein [Candidatus Electronema sp. V4]|uniref:radical SAM protein n=1 Tax=Candidatus Electronema sp. V4 TaxID=3454756 RepID=UPI00405569D8